MARLRGNDGMGLFTAGYDKGCLPVDPHQAARNNGLAWCPQARVADSALTKGTIRHERLQPQGGRGYCSPQQINSGIYHDPGKRNRGNGQIFERRNRSGSATTFNQSAAPRVRETGATGGIYGVASQVKRIPAVAAVTVLVLLVTGCS